MNKEDLRKQNKREYERKWYASKGKEKRTVANNRWEQKKAEEFKIIKAQLRCERCGENHPACLEFHHLDPLKKDGNVGHLARAYSTKRLLEEIKKCIVLCSNCHRKEHYKPD